MRLAKFKSECMISKRVIPILRIFDEQKASEFYIDWLGFKIDWQHRFSEDAPLYMQVSNSGIVLHLTAHHGDTTPGTRVYLEVEQLKEYHKELIEKNYTYNKPGLEESFHGTWCMQVTDPFGNRLTFNEEK